jgi:hypothetical protein
MGEALKIRNENVAELLGNAVQANPNPPILSAETG